MPEKLCKECGIVIPEVRTRAGSTVSRIFCTGKCKSKAYKRQKRERNPDMLARHRKVCWENIKANPEALERHRKQSSHSKEKIREWLADYKLSRGCVDCGYKEHYAALQLDHEGPKKHAIADIRSSIPRLLKEIEEGQCVVRCTNCHSVITWKRKMGLV